MADEEQGARRREFIADMNGGSGEWSKRRADDFRAAVGHYHVLDVRVDPAAAFHARVRYEVPLAWCHSFDPGAPLGTAEGDSNLPGEVVPISPVLPLSAASPWPGPTCRPQ
jgi:hypothetical protein